MKFVFYGYVSERQLVVPGQGHTTPITYRYTSCCTTSFVAFCASRYTVPYIYSIRHSQRRPQHDRIVVVCDSVVKRCSGPSRDPLCCFRFPTRPGGRAHWRGIIVGGVPELATVDTFDEVDSSFTLQDCGYEGSLLTDDPSTPRIMGDKERIIPEPELLLELLDQTGTDLFKVCGM